MKKIVCAVLLLVVGYVVTGVVGGVASLPDRDSSFSSVDGLVERKISGKWRSVGAGDDISVGDEIRLSEGASADISLRDGSFLRVDEGSSFILLEDAISDMAYDSGVSLRLIDGRIWAFTPELFSPNSSFEVLSGSGKISSMGTSFMVLKNGESTKVSTVRHAVDVNVDSAEGDFSEIVVVGSELYFDNDLNLKRGSINHNDREDSFFKYNFQKDIKYLDGLEKDWYDDVKSIAGVMPGSMLYEAKLSFEDFWKTVGSDESRLNKELGYVNRRLMESIVLMRKGRVGLAKDHLVLYENGMDDILAKINQGELVKNNKLQQSWALYGVVVSEGLGLTEDDKVVREVVQRQAYELAPEDDKKILEYRFAKRMMYKVLDLDDAGFASDSSYAFGEYYQLSSKLFREENSKYVDEMVDFLLIGDLASRSLTPEIRRQFSALRVEYLGNISRALKSAEEKYKNDILGLLVDQLSYGSGLTEKYLLLKEISLEADDAIKAVVLGYEMSLLDSIRAKYIAIDTPEERKSFISSLYYSFDSNEDLLNEFLLKFKKGLSYDFNYELDTMSKGSVYIPPKALSMIDELRPHISEVEMESFIEEMRYRSFSEDEMVSHIERKMNQINFRAKTSHGVGVTYQQGGETKKANIPFLSTKKIKKKIVDDVVTEESVTSKVVDEVVTSEK